MALRLWWTNSDVARTLEVTGVLLLWLSVFCPVFVLAMVSIVFAFSEIGVAWGIPCTIFLMLWFSLSAELTGNWEFPSTNLKAPQWKDDAYASLFFLAGIAFTGVISGLLYWLV